MKHWTPANQELAALKAKQAGDEAVSDDMVAAVDAFLATQQGRSAEALKMLATADTTNFLVMSRMAEAHAALGHTAEAARWNKKITSNYQLNLADFTAVNSRRRARGPR